MKDNKVVGSDHHGFMEGKLCLTNLIAFHNEMIGLMDGGGNTGCCLLSFRKALALPPIRSLVTNLLHTG